MHGGFTAEEKVTPFTVSPSAGPALELTGWLRPASKSKSGHRARLLEWTFSIYQKPTTASMTYPWNLPPLR